MTVAFALWCGGWHSKPVPPWILAPARAMLPDGSTAYEVDGDEIKEYNTAECWLAIQFWKDYRKFGLHTDWRKLTPQQKKLIILYDELAELRVIHSKA